ncbi:Proton-dependent oligopeptide transporter [Trema orientale]|uniref:Proton-dependent oligopeptide transporter n=1 Tax=Trema orientale TaxID=63057 RepID=A0A2P5CWC3_TREOI|nr:Proton-dependent oligopeptide transporter [Trema orientale]
MEEDDIYTKDGTVDIQKNPANKRKTGNWTACNFILGNQCFERLAYYGMSTNLMNYLETSLNQGNVSAANNVTNWNGTCNVTALIGAFLADAYLGKYWTIASFSLVYVLGMTLLTMSASLTTLKPSCDHTGRCHPTPSQTLVCFVALYMVALGSGAIKPCVSSFGADQFDKTDQIERKNQSSFFNWFYLSLNLGMLIGNSIVVWIQMNIGWAWGFGVPAVALAAGVGFFLLGSRLYRLQESEGSSLTRIFQVVVASLRKFNVRVPSHKSLLYETNEHEDSMSEFLLIQVRYKLEHTNELRFFDKAAVETPTDRTLEGLSNPWTLCTVTQVEELKSIIRLLPVWACGVVFATVFSQMSAMFILQGNTMDPHVGGLSSFKIPSASLSFFNALGVIIGTPTYDRLIVPYATKHTGREQGFTQLQRIGIGLAISVFAMVSAGALEVFRLDIVEKYEYYDVEYVPVSILWQVPQYFLVGVAEVFTFIGEYEFFYDQAPNSMRSLCSALFLTTYAGGNFLSTLLVSVVTKVTTKNGKLGWIPDNLNRGHLDYFFWLLTILSLLNLFFYLWIAMGYTYKNVIMQSA